MFGPPGNGKTLLAKAIAAESGATFFNISASTLMSKYVGESEKILQAVFKFASISQPSVIFFDEIDSMLRARSDGEADYTRRLKTEFLCLVDGISSDKESSFLFVIGATNRPQDLDSAVLRRFDKRILVDIPTQDDRVTMLQNCLNDVKHSVGKKDLVEIAKKLEGYSGSDITGLIKAAVYAPLKDICRSVDFITMDQSDLPLLTKKHFMAEIKKSKPSCEIKEIEILRKWAQ